MARKLTSGQAAAYERDGFICPVDAFSPDQARGWRDKLEAFERAEGQKMTRGHNFKPHLLFPWVDEIVHAPEVLDAVEDLIGPDIRLFHLTVWPKDAGSGTYVSWHQDATYFALEPVCHVTAWVALTDASIEAGCMEVVPGSHKLGQLRHADMQDPENLLSRGQTFRGRRRSVEDGLHAGEGRAVLAAPHAPGAQFAAQPLERPAHRARHQLHPDLCALHGARRVSAMLVRGSDSYGHFDDERRPLAEAGPEERASHAQAVATFRAMNADLAGASNR